jgi:hypothetical protein
MSDKDLPVQLSPEELSKVMKLTEKASEVITKEGKVVVTQKNDIQLRALGNNKVLVFTINNIQSNEGIKEEDNGIKKIGYDQIDYDKILDEVLRVGMKAFRNRIYYQAVERADGVQTKAAKMMGVGRLTMHKAVKFIEGGVADISPEDIDEEDVLEVSAEDVEHIGEY